ncbi:hypothetical protein FH972_012789 [Carpinus fangiana]|uniref:Uncharacterized protein n=1 Tax=Carpinus fangiana TaxID=176857 RepID=A0A5N6R528_9ROSI|nr:hypothetical protein FH972_012789 [Carpinus fangiana]
MAAVRITNRGFSTTKKVSTSLWWVRLSSTWVHRMRLAKLRWWSFRMMAEPTRP